MVIDTSALVAILLQEPEGDRLVRAIVRDTEPLLSAANLVEAGMILQYRYGDDSRRDLDHLLVTLSIEVAPVSVVQAELAREAHRRFGKGLHPAGLNYGDCFAYALAQERDLPLLFKGDDFSRTDLEIVAY